MKKLISSLVLAIMLAMGSGVFAQTTQQVKTPPNYTYCQVSFSQAKLTAVYEVTMSIDWGQNHKDEKNKFFPVYLVDENNKAVVFNSPIDGLNYMAQLGWEFVQAFPVENVVRFILRKEIKNTEDIGFYIDSKGVHEKK